MTTDNNEFNVLVPGEEQKFHGNTSLVDGRNVGVYTITIDRCIFGNENYIKSDNSNLITVLQKYASKVNAFSCENYTKWFEKLSEKQQQALLDSDSPEINLSCCSLCSNIYSYDQLLHIDEQGNVCHCCQYIITCIGLGISFEVYDESCQDLAPTAAMIAAIINIDPTKNNVSAVYKVIRGNIEQYFGPDTADKDADDWGPLCQTQSKSKAIDILKKMGAVPMFPELKEGNKGYNQMWCVYKDDTSAAIK